MENVIKCYKNNLDNIYYLFNNVTDEIVKEKLYSLLSDYIDLSSMFNNLSMENNKDVNMINILYSIYKKKIDNLK
jgi:hypothetical protein